MYTCTLLIFGGYTLTYEVIEDSDAICGEPYTYVNIGIYYDYGRCFYTNHKSKNNNVILYTENRVIPSVCNRRINIYNGVALLYKMYKYHEIKVRL